MSSKSGSGNGFVFHEYASMPFFQAIRRAVEMFQKDPEDWRELQRRGMKADRSWESSAKEYVNLYREALKKARPQA